MKFNGDKFKLKMFSRKVTKNKTRRKIILEKVKFVVSILRIIYNGLSLLHAYAYF